MFPNFYIAPIIGNQCLNPNQISEYIHNSFSAFSKIVNIDTSISQLGIHTSFSKLGGYNVIIPKKDITVKQTVASFQRQIKPVLENALYVIRKKYEKEFIELQQHITLQLKRLQMQYSQSTFVEEQNHCNFLCEKLQMDYQSYAYGNYHFLYPLAVGGFKDMGEYISIHIVVYAFPSISF